jgi:predicted GTPase
MSVVSRNLSQDVQQYSVLVMGVTGAGKSRLVNMLAGDGVAKEAKSTKSCKLPVLCHQTAVFP